MNICVIGVGYVGLTTAVCLAEYGHNVYGVDEAAWKVEQLNQGMVPFYEPGMEELLSRNQREGRIMFGTDIAEMVRRSDVIFLTVGTPSRLDGEADLSQLESAAISVGKSINGYKLIVIKSTAPVGTARKLETYIQQNANLDADFDVAVNPEFLREGSAIHDMMHPDRIVIGAATPNAARTLAELYEPLGRPILQTVRETAEMIKYASNAFLATKISFINEIAHLCEHYGADVVDVSKGMGMDPRIGADFLRAGAGYGGSCFPKDTKTLIKMGERVDVNLQIVRAAVDVNQYQEKRILSKLGAQFNGIWADKVIGVLGLSFKAHTDDTRCSAALNVIPLLQRLGCEVKAYDPVAIPNAEKSLTNVTFCVDPYEALRGTDAAVIFTDWPEIAEIDWELVRHTMHRPFVLDGRNVCDPREMVEIGFEYEGIGRPKIHRVRELERT